MAFRPPLRATAIALLCAVAVSAQGGGGLVEVVPKDPDAGLRYLLLRPAKTKPGRLYPFVLSLHGTGMTIEQYSRSARQVSTSDVPVFVAIPHHEKRVERLAPLHDNLMPKLLAVVDEVTAEYPIDRGRMFVHGYSRGGHISSRFAYGWKKWTERPFPFRAVYMCAGYDPPRRAGPKGVPMLFMVGARDINQFGNFDFVTRGRKAYLGQFTRGADADYIEFPNYGHSVNPGMLEVIREHIASYPDHQGAIPKRKKWPQELAPVLRQVLAGDFAGAFDGLDELAASQSENAELQKRVVELEKSATKYLEKRASSFARRRRPVLADYVEALELSTALANRPELAAAFATASDKIAARRRLAPEIEARAAYLAAQELAATDLEAATEKLKELSKGKLRKTAFGQRAARHVEATLPVQASEATGRKKNKKR